LFPVVVGAWGGGFGTQFVIDPARRMAAVLMLNQGNQFDWVFSRFRELVNQTLAWRAGAVWPGCRPALTILNSWCGDPKHGRAMS
jgi:CubicO group peptidase (beta-lactamase class C family)